MVVIVPTQSPNHQPKYNLERLLLFLLNHPIINPNIILNAFIVPAQPPNHKPNYNLEWLLFPLNHPNRDCEKNVIFEKCIMGTFW